jgi:hypothetical protein
MYTHDVTMDACDCWWDICTVEGENVLVAPWMGKWEYYEENKTVEIWMHGDRKRESKFGVTYW